MFYISFKIIKEMVLDRDNQYIVVIFGGLILEYFSILGGLLIVCGLYMVLWGKRKEMKMKQPPSSENPQESQIQSIENVSITLDE